MNERSSQAQAEGNTEDEHMKITQQKTENPNVHNRKEET